MMMFTRWVVDAGLQKECRRYYMAKDRCTNPKNKDYRFYGGRGIKFELLSFKQFIAELGPAPAGYTLDRIDTNGNYAHSNIRWADMATQIANRRPENKLSRTGHKYIYNPEPGVYIVRRHGKYYGCYTTLNAAIKGKQNAEI